MDISNRRGRPASRTLRGVKRRFPTRQRLAARPPRPVDGRRVFGTNLRRARRARGVTQEALAEATGLDRSYLSHVENAHCNVSLDNICKLAATLGVEPHELLLREE